MVLRLFAVEQGATAGLAGMGELLRQFDKILRLIGFKLFDAGFAAKFDLLSIIDLGDGAAHAVEVVATDEAFCEWVRLGFVSGERWLWRCAGC
jgi:hypothetical protein